MPENTQKSGDSMDPLSIVATVVAVKSSGILDSLKFWKDKTQHLDYPTALKVAQEYGDAIVSKLKASIPAATVDNELARGFATAALEYLRNYPQYRWGGMPQVQKNLQAYLNGELDWLMIHLIVDYVASVGMFYDVSRPQEFVDTVKWDMLRFMEQAQATPAAIAALKKVTIVPGTPGTPPTTSPAPTTPAPTTSTQTIVAGLSVEPLRTLLLGGLVLAAGFWMFRRS